ncbi:MAG TPA: PrsW family intramembrane metalloprotease [Actinopolymorphaceae bacterium]
MTAHHGPPPHGPQPHGPLGPPAYGPLGHGPQSHGPPAFGPTGYNAPGAGPPSQPPPGPPPPPAGYPGHQPWMVSRRRRVFWPVVAVVVMAFLGLAVLGLTVWEVGLAASVFGSLAAFLPLVAVISIYLWIDRWEPEPPGLLWMTLLWGSCIAVPIALVLNTAAELYLRPVAGARLSTILTGSIVAPIVEEAAKGLFLIILVARRGKEFDGIVDGIVYAGLVAIGFAFIENILYLGRAFADEGLEGGIHVFVLRCVLSPFSHPLFTTMIGIAIGVMVRSRRPGRFLLPVLGYLGAALLHGLWNASSFILGVGFFLVYALVMVPIFVLLVILVLWQRSRERRTVATQLPRFVAAGWLAPYEVPVLANMRTRRQWRTLAKIHWGKDGAKAVRTYQVAATELAFLNDRLTRGTVGPEGQQWFHEVASAFHTARQHLATAYPQALPAAAALR